MVSKFSVMLVAFVKCMFHNNLIDGPTVQPLYVKSKKQTFCECNGPGKGPYTMALRLRRC
jgi:hypothetical protein